MFNIQDYEQMTKYLNPTNRELLENVLGKDNPIVEQLLKGEGKA
jgi:predicted transcriptional regulator